MLKRKNQNRIYYPNVFKRIKANIIDSITIILSIFLTLTCLIINNYSKQLSTQMNKIEFINTDDKTLTVSTNEYSELLNNSNINMISNIWTCKSYNYFAETNFGTLYLGKTNFQVNALSVGKFDKKMILPSFDQIGATEKVTLIEGSIPSFTEHTEDNYIYLHKSIKKFVFGDIDDVIGKEMQFYFNNSYHKFKIAGILSDSLDVLRLVDKYNKNQSNLTYNLYSLPIVHVNKSLDNITKMLIFMDKEITQPNLEIMRKQLSNSSFRDLKITSLSDQLETKKIMINANDKIVRIILNIVTFVLAGISILLIFLSIKKRKIEIGIRKSIGASNYDLIVMFLSEILLCFALSALYSIPISTFVMLFISLIIKKDLYTLLFPINFSIYAIPLSLMFLVVIFSSLITILFFSNKKISTCLKEQ